MTAQTFGTVLLWLIILAIAIDMAIRVGHVEPGLPDCAQAALAVVVEAVPSFC